MSKRLYFDLYKKFVSNTISESEYLIFMEWVKKDVNQGLLRQYMEEIWEVENEVKGIYDNSWNEFQLQLKVISESEDSNLVNKYIQPIRWAAAVLLLIFVGYGVITYLGNSEILYTTTFGEKKTIILEDGSKVVLNANSKMVWDSEWQNKSERKVVLDGEAFFDIVHMVDDQGFKVETEDLTINVLGTSFNVNSRRDATDVLLKSGKISLDLKREEDRRIEMVPGDRVDFSLNTNELKLERAVEEKIIDVDWLNGVLNFEDVSVGEMLKEIEDLYGKQFSVVDTILLNRRMYTSIPYADWSVVLKTLELSLGVTIKENKNKLLIKNE